MIYKIRCPASQNVQVVKRVFISMNSFVQEIAQTWIHSSVFASACSSTEYKK